MSLIIIDDKYYKAAIQSLKSKLNTDKKFNYQDFPVAVDNIPSSADGTDNPITGIYFLNPNENGYPTKIKVSGWKLANFPIAFTNNFFAYVEQIEFFNCNNTSFNASTFANLKQLVKLVIPDTLKSLPNGFCNGCTSIQTVTIPNNVTHIGPYAFDHCSNITTINIPDGVITIDFCAFRQNIRLKSITIPSSVTSIASDAFFDDYNLEYVTLGDNFNCNNLVLSVSSKYSRETIVSWLNALADRTGQTAYKLTIGANNLAKLTEEDILIATNKNWTLA